MDRLEKVATKGALVDALKATYRGALREGKKTVAVLKGKNVASAEKNLATAQRKYKGHAKAKATAKANPEKASWFDNLKGSGKKTDEAVAKRQSRAAKKSKATDKRLYENIQQKSNQIDVEKARTAKYQRRAKGTAAGVAAVGTAGLIAGSGGGKSGQQGNALSKQASRMAAWREGAEQFAKRVVGKNQKGAKEALEAAEKKRPTHRVRKNNQKNRDAAERLERYNKKSVAPKEKALADEVGKTRKARKQLAGGTAALTAAGYGAKKLSD